MQDGASCLRYMRSPTLQNVRDACLECQTGA